MRIPLKEYTSVKEKDASYKTVSSYNTLEITQEDFIELQERLKLIYQLEERSRNHCKTCSEQIGCHGCVWGQIKFKTANIEFILRSALRALKKEDSIKIPDWKVKENEESDKNFIDYCSIFYPGQKVTFHRHLAKAQWRIKDGTIK